MKEQLLEQNGTLLDSISYITLKRNIKGVLAADPGKLTAELSTDNKTLPLHLIIDLMENMELTLLIR